MSKTRNAESTRFGFELRAHGYAFDHVTERRGDSGPDVPPASAPFADGILSDASNFVLSWYLSLEMHSEYSPSDWAPRSFHDPSRTRRRSHAVRLDTGAHGGGVCF